LTALLPAVDHVAIGLSRIAEQYRGRPKFTMWVACFLQQVQYLEEAITATVDAWDVDTATGWRLEVLGSRVGQPKVGSDDIYRLFIKARIRSNRSLGLVSDLLAVADLLLGPGTYSYRELPENVYFESRGLTQYLSPDAATTVQQLLQRTASAGVRVWLTCNSSTPAGRQPLIRRAARSPSDLAGGHQSARSSSYSYGYYVSLRA
jgi:hypothetical protein